MKGSCMVLQSGGPTSVINSSLYGVITQSLKEENITNIYGSLNGIEGIINNNIICLNNQPDLELLLTTPGAILGSSRKCLPSDFKDEVYNKILETLKKLDVRFLFLIGGNDSMDTANKLSIYFKKVGYECYVIGVPKTVDNDLVETDHTPGYGSAVKYIANVLSEIEQDICCYKKGKVTVVEIMGRDAGWMTAGSKLASLNGNGPDLIYLPETPFDYEDFLNKVNEIYSNKQYVLVAISEGIKDTEGQYVATKNSSSTTKDLFNHVQLGGAASYLVSLVKSRLNLPIRSVELNLPQRCASHLASLTDITEAKKCGMYAVKCAVKGTTGKMISMKRISTFPYKIKYCTVSLKKIANNVKEFPSAWIIGGCNISNEFIEYVLPLINKEPRVKYEKGLIKFAKLIKNKVE